MLKKNTSLLVLMLMLGVLCFALISCGSQTSNEGNDKKESQEAVNTLYGVSESYSEMDYKSFVEIFNKVKEQWRNDTDYAYVDEKLKKSLKDTDIIYVQENKEEYGELFRSTVHHYYRDKEHKELILAYFSVDMMKDIDFEITPIEFAYVEDSNVEDNQSDKKEPMDSQTEKELNEKKKSDAPFVFARFNIKVEEKNLSEFQIKGLKKSGFSYKDQSKYGEKNVYEMDKDLMVYCYKKEDLEKL